MPDEIKIKPWVGIDLDKTLAEATDEYQEGKIGKPLWPMVNFAHWQLNLGNKVKIFTSRADNPADIEAIKAWLIDEAGLPLKREEFEKAKLAGNAPDELEVSNIKDKGCIMLIDDLAWHARPNTGLVEGMSLPNNKGPATRLPHRQPFRLSR
jgi:hypothetical protein